MARRMIGVLVFLAVLALSAVLRADSAIDGKWQFDLQTDGGPRQVAVEMTTDGEQVTGTWDTTELKGTFKDNKLALSFPLTSAEAGFTADLIIDGTLEGDGLKGTWKFGDYGGTFTATKKAQQ
jgi:hypothetical protein